MEAVILMAKAPFAGAVKTRLVPPLSPEGASRLYEGMLLDSAAAIRAVAGIERFLFHAAPGAERYFRAPPFRDFRLAAQSGADLGERMVRAFEAAFALGASRVLVAGADCPALSPARIRTALRELRDGAEAVFAPTLDGGFHLAGFASPPRVPFGPGIGWGGASVLAAVTARCRSLGAPYSLLPRARDVDTPADLAWLEREFARGRMAGAFPETGRRISGPACAPAS